MGPGTAPLIEIQNSMAWLFRRKKGVGADSRFFNTTRRGAFVHLCFSAVASRNLERGGRSGPSMGLEQTSQGCCEGRGAVGPWRGSWCQNRPYETYCHNDYLMHPPIRLPPRCVACPRTLSSFERVPRGCLVL